ncbi:LPS O-antigen chain length determinant protein WzzB [Vibrio gallicus]|uniref:LPS O-antigen chain length determinant protein WzzB n=1 Tax=Vibrio gallicus TaxID=190897 RepID=UPI0029056852|nr:Wzz/FepE/Etk N-terminal domain-containing protein [Vibrio gallicus]
MKKQTNLTTGQPDLAMNGYYDADDEIDLRELFVALWKGKWLIVFTTFIFAAIAIAYALTAQQWWSSNAKITEPQSKDIQSYQLQVRQFQPVFDVYQDDGSILVSKSLDNLIDPKVVFERYIRAFNSANSKRDFLDNSAEFKTFQQQLFAETSDEELEDAERRLYADWFEKITATPIEKGDKSSYTISLQATTKEGSFNLLNEYIKLVEKRVYDDALDNLQAKVEAKRNELTQQKLILETQAKNRLAVEQERAQLSLDIAKAAQVNAPIRTSQNDDLFAIDLGAKGLQAKINALQSVKNLSVIEPRLQQINAKLKMLETLKIDRKISFDTFRYLEDVAKPISRDKPKRALIAVLGALFGGMLGVGIVLVRFAFGRREIEE